MLVQWDERSCGEHDGATVTSSGSFPGSRGRRSCCATSRPGGSIEDTAKATDLPINTVRSRLRLAKARLRARIERNPCLREVFGRP